MARYRTTRGLSASRGLFTGGRSSAESAIRAGKDMLTSSDPDARHDGGGRLGRVRFVTRDGGLIRLAEEALENPGPIQVPDFRVQGRE